MIAAGTDDDAVLSFRRDPATGALTRIVVRLGLPRDAGCMPSTLVGGPRSLAVRPNALVVWVGASRGDSIVTLQLDAATSALTPTAGPGGCVRRLASLGMPRGAGARRSTRPRRERRRRARLRGQRAERRSRGARPAARAQLPEMRAKTVANLPNSVVLACSDPNGDKIALTIVKLPRHGRVSGLVKATGSIIYTPVLGYVGSDSFTYTATDGMDIERAGTATVTSRSRPRRRA